MREVWISNQLSTLDKCTFGSRCARPLSAHKDQNKVTRYRIFRTIRQITVDVGDVFWPHILFSDLILAVGAENDQPFFVILWQLLRECSSCYESD